MYDEITGQGRPAPRKKRHNFARRERPAPPRRDDLLRIASSGRIVDVYDTLDSPMTSLLAAEDAVWQFERAEWAATKPRWFRLAQRRAWQEEGTRLEEKRQRLVELTGSVRTLGRTV